MSKRSVSPPPFDESHQAENSYATDSKAQHASRADRETQQTVIDDSNGEETGVKKAEAVTLAWSQNAVWAIYAWYAHSIYVRIHNELIYYYFLGSGSAFSC